MIACGLTPRKGGETMFNLRINFFAYSKYLLPGIKVSSKTYILGSKRWRPKYSLLAIQSISCQINDKQNSIIVKGIVVVVVFLFYVHGKHLWS